MVTGNETTVHTESEEKPAVHLQIKCRIEKFEPMMNSAKPGEDLWSEGVKSELAPRAVWKLVAYPNGNCEQDKGNVSVFLNLTGPMVGEHSALLMPGLQHSQVHPLQKDNKESLDATLHLFLVDGSGKIDSIGRYTKKFGQEYRWSGWDVNHARVKKALHADGSLMVAADIDFFLPDESGAKVIGKNALRNYEDRAQWAAKFFQLYNNQASSDCTIQIGGVSISAHKSILMAHSPIFHAMFTHKEAEEFQSGTVKITDFEEPEPMRAVVRYCYLGCLDAAAMEDNCAVEIFKLADRYCIKGLKSILERHFLEKRLSKENVIALAVLADAHSAPKLKEACIQLIAREGKAVYESADWKEVMKARPELTTQLAVGAATLLATKK